MSKKLTIVITVIIILAVTTFLTNDTFDRFNPFLQEEKSYAIVKQHTQQYNDVTAYSKNGEKLNYKLTFGGYDPSKKFVEIIHKGTYVKEIHYIEKQALPKNIR